VKYLRGDLVLHRVLGTIPRHSIPCRFRFCRAIKLYSVMWCNLAVVRAVCTVIDVAAAITDDGVRRGRRSG